MKLIVRTMTLFMCMTFLVLAFNHISSIEIRKNEMRLATSAAFQQTQKVIAMEISDRLQNPTLTIDACPGTEANPRACILSNSDYADYFREMFEIQINSKTHYDIMINEDETDWQKGILSVTIRATFDTYAGIPKTLTFSKKSEVNINGLRIPKIRNLGEDSLIMGHGTDSIIEKLLEFYNVNDYDAMKARINSYLAGAGEPYTFDNWYIDRELTMPLDGRSDDNPYVIDDLDPQEGDLVTRDNYVHPKLTYRFYYYDSPEAYANMSIDDEEVGKASLVYDSSTETYKSITWGDWVETPDNDLLNNDKINEICIVDLNTHAISQAGSLDEITPDGIYYRQQGGCHG